MILLLAISLLPLVFMGLVGRRGTAPLGEDIAGQARQRFVRDTATAPAGKIGAAITDSLASLRADSPQLDDVTLVVMKLA